MRRTGALLLLAVLTLVVACADEDAPTADGLTPVTLMLNWTPNNHHAGIYLAEARGWYGEAGIDLRIVEPSQAGADAVVATGGADFGISQSESLLPARSEGAPIVAIATLLPYNDSSLMVLGDRGITRPRDLAGKRYGGYGGALETQLVKTLVACDGADPESVNFVEVGNIDYLVGMSSGRFDFVWVFEGWDVLRARAVTGANVASIKFVDYQNCIPDWYTPIIIASEKTLAERPELARRFLEATTRGYQAAAREPLEAANALLAAAPELDADLVKASAVYHASRYLADDGRWGFQQADTWSRFAAFLRRAKLLEKDVDTTKAFTNDYLPR
ncbi:MAG: ABC transporter substrate-binding protein [Dehalococcoidia bacterium]|nr:ABC transporter substrate-binding protein [Dehalococcoidia bacterium]